MFISMLGSVVAAPPTASSSESKAKTFLLRGRPFTHVRLEGTVVAAPTAAGGGKGKCTFVLDDGTGTPARAFRSLANILCVEAIIRRQHGEEIAATKDQKGPEFGPERCTAAGDQTHGQFGSRKIKRIGE